jgi:hypothetical protein
MSGNAVLNGVPVDVQPEQSTTSVLAPDFGPLGPSRRQYRTTCPNRPIRSRSVGLGLGGHRGPETEVQAPWLPLVAFGAPALGSTGRLVQPPRPGRCGTATGRFGAACGVEDRWSGTPTGPRPGRARCGLVLGHAHAAHRHPAGHKWRYPRHHPLVGHLQRAGHVRRWH